jgi:hypothetical protein
MRIAVRGWGRDQGETVLIDKSLSSAEEPGERLSIYTLYKRLLDLDNKRRTKVRIMTSTEVRLGGTYLLSLELSRKEIADLFFETHAGAMVRLIKSFLEDEEKEDRALELKRRRERMAELEKMAAEEES